ncbi:MAG: copper ABC transporter permease, partial [Singulisphaera sp.]
PTEIRAALDGRDWDSTISLPFTYWRIQVRLDPGLIRTFSVSLALHAVGAIVASRAAAWAFDARRGRQS